ncbi:response regulator transcription factor [Kitasatospora saccharophila]|uniref:Response regulator transcription factor n=1 Tax=Kitasatospora saccharophila TaxID=407973 RepID=A0ABN2XTD3_9ACTN
MADPPATPSYSRHRAVVVADPFPVPRAAIAALLRRSGAADETVEAASPQAALDAVRRLDAAVLITEVDLLAPGDGVLLCRQAKALAKPPSVLVFTGADDPAVVAACLSGGVDALVHRTASPERLVRAVEAVAVGRPVWYLREPQPGTLPFPAGRDRLPGMTGREQEVLGLLLRRFSNEEIALELHLARQTVKNHVSSVLHKLGMANRRELLGSVRGIHGSVPAGPLRVPAAAS